MDTRNAEEGYNLNWSLGVHVSFNLHDNISLIEESLTIRQYNKPQPFEMSIVICYTLYTFTYTDRPLIISLSSYVLSCML